MADRCRPRRPDHPAEAQECPRSGTPGHAVNLNTVKALLMPAALARVSEGVYRFCTHRECDVVYFSPSGLYTIGDLRVPVWQKQAAGARMMCYCFDENEADIRREIERHGGSAAIARVSAHIAAGRCACELRNPRGACCLGDLIAAVKRMTAEVEMRIGK
jgi:hypothetical protein